MIRSSQILLNTILFFIMLHSTNMLLSTNIITLAYAEAESTNSNESSDNNAAETNSNEKECSIDEKESYIIANDNDDKPIKTNDKGHRLITVEELSTKLGSEDEKDKSPIWLSVMGQVYDVTAGNQYYGPKSGYKFFAGKDASASFATGEFNEKGLEFDVHNNATKKDIQAIEHWRKFYAEHDVYTFVGVLADGRFYDEENGNPTHLLKKWRMNIKKIEDTKKERKTSGVIANKKTS